MGRTILHLERDTTLNWEIRLFSSKSLDDVAMIVRRAVARRCNELRGGHIVKEETFSESLMTTLRDNLNDLRLTYEPSYQPRGSRSPRSVYQVHARVTSSPFLGSEENRSGADILMGFRGEIAGESIKKAVLLQAKLFKEAGFFRHLPTRTAEKEYLRLQCRRMVRIAGEAAYVVTYSYDGVRFYSANEYIRNFASGLSYEDGKDFDEFVRELFACSIGNHALDYMTEDQFKEYLEAEQIGCGFDAEVTEDEHAEDTDNYD